MTTSWVAGVVRARALQRRRLGRAGARRLAQSPSLQGAVSALAGSPYGHDVRPGMDRGKAQRAVTESALWNLRVLAGWLPSTGAETLRVLAGWFEIANVDGVLRELQGLRSEPPYRLGTLATAWPQLDGSTSLTQLAQRLAATSWGEPDVPDVWDVQLRLRLVWAQRVGAYVPPAAGMVGAGAALLLARELVCRGRPLPPSLVGVATRLVGGEALGARTLMDFAAALPGRCRWVLEGVVDSQDLWTAEARWWRRLEERAFALGRSGSFDSDQVLSAVGLLAVDAWRVRAALALAGSRPVQEVLDAVA